MIESSSSYNNKIPGFFFSFHFKQAQLNYTYYLKNKQTNKCIGIEIYGLERQHKPILL